MYLYKLCEIDSKSFQENKRAKEDTRYYDRLIEFASNGKIFEACDKL